MTRVTVAICTCNRCEYLKESLRSVLNQTYRDMKITVYDNASTDGTEQAVKAFKDPRITYVKNETNIGAAANMNQAFARLDTEYLVIFHDDDVMLPCMIQREVEVLDRYPKAAMAGQVFGCALIDGKGRVFQDKTPKKTSVLVFEKGQYIHMSVRENRGTIFTCPSVMFRGSAIEQHGIRFDERCGGAMDWLLWLKINTLDCQMAGIKGSLMRYREHQDQWSAFASRQEGYEQSYLYIYNWLKSNNAASRQDLETLKVYMIAHSLKRFGYGLLESPKDYLKTLHDAKDGIAKLERLYETKLTDYRRVFLDLLSPVAGAIAEGKARPSYYLKLRRAFIEVFQVYPDLKREAWWVLRYFLYERFFKRNFKL